MSKFQPTFDFISGEEIPAARQTLRETFRQSTATVKPDIANESLRAQLNTLQYELDSLKQEKELTALENGSEIREAQQRAEIEFQRAQTAENKAQAATKRLDSLSRDLQESQDRATNERIQLDRKIRNLQSDNQSLREDLEDAQTQLSSAERQFKHGQGELEARHSALQAAFEEAQRDLDAKVAALQSTQERLSQREAECGTLENEVLRLKAQTGDADTLGVIKRELSEQVAHIKTLEAANQKQMNELKALRKQHKSVEIVEEEKRVLESKVRMMEDLRRELSEAQLQRQILEDEKHSWTSYLESGAATRMDMTFNSPEEMAKAFVNERMERLSLVEKVGALEPEVAVRDDSIRNLEDEKARLTAELGSLRNTAATATANTTTGAPGPGDAKARARLERQKNLAVKEVEYLRASMKALEDEQAEFSPERANEAANTRLQELELLIDQYRSEVESLHKELSSLESSPQQKEQQPPISALPSTEGPNPLKRAHDDESAIASDERLGELRRKTRTLQTDLSTLQARNSALETELQATSSQLSALRSSSRVRVLELRDNPTATATAIKQSTLETLRSENAALLAQLETRLSQDPSPPTKLIPLATLEHARLRTAELESALAQRDKKTTRLKTIWTAKFREFADAVAATLGWTVVFQPNGRFKVTSVLWPAHVNAAGEEEENSILFDGERGTMKVSGGEGSRFAREIRGAIEFWVDGRKEIPCFLAALTLEFYERAQGGGGEGGET